MKRPSWLTRLLEKGTAAHSTADRRSVEELLALGIVRLQSAGLKQTVVAADPDQLRLWAEARYPCHPIDPDTLPTREGNIVRSGGSKSGRSAHRVLPLQFKWFGPGPLAEATSRFGVAAVLTDRVSALPLPAEWRLLTIENWEPFQRADYAAAPVPVMVAYLGGNVSEIVIEALQRFGTAPEVILHFGDYDWDGLNIFQRLQKTVPCARLYVPPNIEALFARFGSRRLLEKQKRKTVLDSADPDCRRIITQIEQHNAGLEQEIVALPPLI